MIQAIVITQLYKAIFKGVVMIIQEKNEKPSTFSLVRPSNLNSKPRQYTENLFQMIPFCGGTFFQNKLDTISNFFETNFGFVDLIAVLTLLVLLLLTIYLFGKLFSDKNQSQFNPDKASNYALNKYTAEYTSRIDLTEHIQDVKDLSKSSSLFGSFFFSRLVNYRIKNTQDSINKMNDLASSLLSVRQKFHELASLELDEKIKLTIKETELSEHQYKKMIFLEKRENFFDNDEWNFKR